MFDIQQRHEFLKLTKPEARFLVKPNGVAMDRDPFYVVIGGNIARANADDLARYEAQFKPFSSMHFVPV